MKFYFRDNVYGLAMTGLVGKGAKWFFGFSRAAVATPFNEAKATILALPEQDVRDLAIAQFIQLQTHEKYGNTMQNLNTAYRAEQAKPKLTVGEKREVSIPGVRACPNAERMGEHACKYDRSQCWEPCGELGQRAGVPGTLSAQSFPLTDQQRDMLSAKGVSHIPGLAAGVKGLVPVPAWCPTHQHHKWCEHNGGVRGSGGWGAPASGVALPADKRRSDVLADRAPDGSRYDSMCPAGVLGTGSAAGYTTAEFSTLSNQAHGYGVPGTDRGNG